MPNRILREGINDSKRMASLVSDAGWFGEVFYRRLMSKVDDFGRFPADVALLRPELFKRQLEMVREADVSRGLAACEKAGLIRLYAVAGETYLELMDFKQQLRAKYSKWPASDGSCAAVATHVSSKCTADDPHMRPEAESEAETKAKDLRDESRPPESSLGPADLANKPRKERTGDAAEVEQHYVKIWSGRYGENPEVAYEHPKDDKHNQTLRKKCGGDVTKVKIIINRYLADDDKFFIEHRHSLGMLVSQMRRFLVPEPTDANEGKNGEFVRTFTPQMAAIAYPIQPNQGEES